MPGVFLSPLAETDLNEALNYIARDKPGAAVKWLEKIRKTCDKLAKSPELGERRPEFKSGDFRSSLVGSYVIFYRPVAGGIEVARLVRGERDIRNL